MNNKKGVIITIIAAVAVVVVAVALVLVFWPKKSNKEVFTDAIKESFNFTKALKTEDGENIKDVFADHLIKLTLEANDGKAELYAGNDQFYGLLSGVKDGKNINAEALLKGSKVYFTVKDVLSKYYYADIEEGSKEMSGAAAINLNSDKLAEYFSDAFFDVIENDNITKDSDEITINGKSYKADKYSHPFTGKDMYKVIESFVSKLKNDKELRGQLEAILTSAGSEEKINLDEAMSMLLESAASIKEMGNLFTYTIYVYDGEAISQNITLSLDMNGMQIPMSIVIENVEENDRVFYQMYLSAMGQKVYCLVVNQTSDSNIDLSISAMNQNLIEGKITKTDKKFTFKINNTENLPMEFNIEMNFNIIDNLGLDGTIEYEFDGEKGSIKIKSEEVKSIPEVDVSNSAPYEEMTDAEKQALEELFDFEDMAQSLPTENFGFSM